jgi:hypothetical protein
MLVAALTRHNAEHENEVAPYVEVSSTSGANRLTGRVVLGLLRVSKG